MDRRALRPSLACLAALVGCTATTTSPPPSLPAAAAPEPTSTPEPAPPVVTPPVATAPPIPPETPPPALGLPADLPRCDAEPIQYGVCKVTGTYALGTFTGMRGGVWDVWPTLILDDGTTWMLDSIWFRDRRPSLATIERFEGKLVEIVGQLLPMPPRDGGGRNMSVTTLSPIHAIRVLGDAP